MSFPDGTSGSVSDFLEVGQLWLVAENKSDLLNAQSARTAQPKPDEDGNTGAGNSNPSRSVIKLLVSSAGPEHKAKPRCVTGSNRSPKAAGHAKERFLAAIPTVFHSERGLRH